MKKDQNQYAENVKGEHLYIADVARGSKGYFCIGCKAEMQAVKSEIEGRKQFFRHSPKDVDAPVRECTFSNQDYRHSQAISILNRIKTIKVPTLYKYPPKGVEGKINKLKDSYFVKAKYTKAELTFYETDLGEVKWGKNPDINSRNLLIKPDVTFFNPQDEPILLIEIVVTHKVSDEKKVKIKRLGIDMVQIIIPKDSLQNIEKSFYSSNNIKWIYNYEEECTKYIYATAKSSEGISPVDELQRRLFEENFECRRSQINNLIRTIRKNLASKQYREIEQEFELEISRVEANTKRAQYKLDTYREGIRDSVHQKFESREKQLTTQQEGIESDFERKSRVLRSDFEKKEREFKQRSADYEGRYIAKKEKLENEQRTIVNQQRAIEEEQTSVDIAIIQSENSEDPYRIIEEQKDLRGAISKIERDIRSQLTYGERLPKDFRSKREELNERFEAARREITNTIETKNTEGASELSRGIKRLLETERFINDFEKRKDNAIRYRKALDSLRKGLYKNWS